jgi:hypothetical protein
MSMPKRAVVPFLVCLLGTPSMAQRTWVVDRNRGPGFHFLDVPPALTAASDGDTIVVRTGLYTTGTTGKALTLLGEPGAAFDVDSTVGPAPPFRITGLPAGRAFVMAGFTATGPNFTGILECTGNAGRIHLDRLALSNPGGAYTRGPCVIVSSCAAVSITDCRLHGHPALQVSGSQVVVTAGALNGGDAFGFHEFTLPSAPAVVATSGTVHVARAPLTGGAGITYGPFSVNAPPSPAVSATSTTLTLAGSAADAVRAGTFTGTGSFPTSAVVLQGGQLLLDPTLALIPHAGAPALGGAGFALAQRRLPALTVHGGPPGGSIATDLYSPAGHVALLFAGIPGLPVASPLGTLWLDPTAPVLLDTAFQGASQHHAVSIRVPADPLLRGLAVGLQTVSGDVVSAVFELSNAGVVALH